MGTDEKSYETISVDTGDYQPFLEPLDPLYKQNKFDAIRVPANAPWKYLVEKPLESGEVYVKVRGKCLVISAGYVSIQGSHSVPKAVRLTLFYISTH